MRRREALRTGVGALGVAGLAGLAGCAGMFETRSALEPPLVENRPAAVYYPTHTEGMSMIGRKEAGPYTVGVTFSYPHRFWTVRGSESTKVDVRGEDTVHLMTSVWDGETNTVLPTAEASATVSQDGEVITERSLWAMLSQPMGYHFGDNLSLSGDGTYALEVRVPPLRVRRTGDFTGQFEEGVSVEFEFEFARSALEEIPYTQFDSMKGTPGAVEPMEMDMMPLSSVPPTDELPGRVVGSGTSGDGVFPVSVLETPPAGIEDDGAYLAVSSRTPYNGYPLPFMALSAEVERGDETTFEDGLVPTIDPDVGYHYGAVVPSVEAGDVLRLTVDSPPQVARHEGYETAFLEMTEMSLTAE